jgi:hypothetical protein
MYNMQLTPLTLRELNSNKPTYRDFLFHHENPGNVATPPSHNNIAGEHIKNQVGFLLPSSSCFSLYACKSWLSLHLSGPSTPE